jgi:hypothetical protein
MVAARLFLPAGLLAVFSLNCCSRPQPAPEASQSRLVEALLQAKVIQSDLVLVHASHTCDLLADGVPLRVVDARLIGKTAGSPRGFNHIAVFGPDWRLVQDIQYVNQRPLFCKGNQLVLFGDIAIRNEMPEGNVLEFDDKGATVVVKSLDYNSLPTFGEARGFPK